MLRILVPCKINLFLAIRGKDASGYHEIETVFARTRALQDELILERADAFHFECAALPSEGNTVVKAVKLLEAHTGKSIPYKITLKKGIPPRSGLGGGSSDAASTLLALNELEDLRLSKETLLELGAQIGMDVPFFLTQTEVALGTHYGEKITPLPGLPKNLRIDLELGEERSTPEAYAAWDAQHGPSNVSVQPLLEALKNEDALALVQSLHNDFEPLTRSLEAPLRARILAGSGGAHAVLRVVGN